MCVGTVTLRNAAARTPLEAPDVREPQCAHAPQDASPLARHSTSPNEPDWGTCARGERRCCVKCACSEVRGIHAGCRVPNRAAERRMHFTQEIPLPRATTRLCESLTSTEFLGGCAVCGISCARSMSHSLMVGPRNATERRNGQLSMLFSAQW